jgi:Cu/Ag efflux protein CusF
MLNYDTSFIFSNVREGPALSEAEGPDILVRPKCMEHQMKMLKSKSAATLLFLGLLSAGCNQNSAPGESTTSSQPASKHYQLKGKVVSIDTRGKMVNVDSESIPGFMDAMTMPYQVKPESELAKLHPGDAITADLEVQDDGAWLQNIKVAGSGSTAPAPK